MLGVSGEAGWNIVSDPAEAEVIVVNTCGFIGPAKEESIDAILEMGRYKEDRCERLVVAGCLSQRYADSMADEMPEVDHFLGSSDMLKLRRVLEGNPERMLVGNPAEYTMAATDPRTLTESGHRAFIKIAEGCNRTCSFCAIPSIRGKQRSRTVEDVAAEVTSLREQGVREFNLVSQDTIGYGRDLDSRPKLSDLALAVSDAAGDGWVRLHYLYPESLTRELVSAISDRDNILPYIDMPLQHASDGMLRRMRRGHGGKRLYRVVERLREALPDMVFRTTFIVGHPGETDEDFEELMRFVEWAEFDHVGVFLYSHEEGTLAGTMEDLVDDDVAKRRHRQLMSLQRPISRRKLRSRIGEELDVLVDGLSDESDFLLEGRWWGQAPEVDGKIYLANGAANPGDLRKALVTDAADYDLLADLLREDGTHDVPPGGEAPPRRSKVRLKTVD